MRPRVVLVLAIAAIVSGSAMLVPAAYARLAAGSAGEEAASRAAAVVLGPPPPPTLVARPVDIDLGKGNFFSWALLNRASGDISGSANLTAPNSTESMIKVWIVSDFLRRSAEQGKKPSKSELKAASDALRYSDDDATESLYWRNGGDKVLDRLISMCGLTDTKKVVPPGKSQVWWSYTAMSARDAVRMGECVKSGKAAGPEWTEWVLTEMTKVWGTTAAKDQQQRRGGGRWGIIDGLPPEVLEQGPVSIKNGWTPIWADGKWHLNCLAVTDDWVLAVLMRYPISKGLDYGASVCKNVTQQLVAPRPGAALKVPQQLPE